MPSQHVPQVFLVFKSFVGYSKGLEMSKAIVGIVTSDDSGRPADKNKQNKKSFVYRDVRFALHGPQPGSVLEKLYQLCITTRHAEKGLRHRD